MRDLQKDLEICNKATPGPWGETPSEGDCSGWHCPKNMEVCDEDCPMCEEYELYKGAWLEGPDYIEIGDYSYFTDNDARFIAQAREGWPYAIERAIKAEAERCIGETECYFNLKNQIEQLQTENALLRKVEEVGEILWSEAICHRCVAPRACRGCSAHDFKKALSEYLDWKEGQELDKEGER